MNLRVVATVSAISVSPVFPERLSRGLPPLAFSGRVVQAVANRPHIAI